jgi:penicillin-binding protein 1A
VGEPEDPKPPEEGAPEERASHEETPQETRADSVEPDDAPEDKEAAEGAGLSASEPEQPPADEDAPEDAGAEESTVNSEQYAEAQPPAESEEAAVEAAPAEPAEVEAQVEADVQPVAATAPVENDAPAPAEPEAEEETWQVAEEPEPAALPEAPLEATASEKPEPVAAELVEEPVEELAGAIADDAVTGEPEAVAETAPDEATAEAEPAPIEDLAEPQDAEAEEIVAEDEAPQDIEDTIAPEPEPIAEPPVVEPVPEIIAAAAPPPEPEQPEAEPEAEPEDFKAAAFEAEDERPEAIAATDAHAEAPRPSPVEATLFVERAADDVAEEVVEAPAEQALFVEEPPATPADEPAFEESAPALSEQAAPAADAAVEEIEQPPIAALEAAPEEPAESEQPSAPAFGEKAQGALAAFGASLAAFWAKTKNFFRRQDVEPGTGPLRIPRIKAPSPRRVLIMIGWMTVGLAVMICGFFIYLTKDMPSTRALWAADNSPSLTFVDRNGRVIIREGAENAPPVDISRLPVYVPQAVIAIEDRRFYDHFGVDLSGLMRAAASNFKAGHVVQGGSTITQQLAKNLFLTNNRTFRRKAQEVALALWLESQFNKREILSLYMSRVYFGAGAYGIEAAAERYFDKPAKNLTLAEAALLAGLVKAPSKLNPAAQDTAAKARAKIVLDEMLAANFITPAQHEAALRAPLQISRNNPNGNLGYFRDWIDPQLVRILGDQRDDFIVETTLDLEAQRAGEQALETVVGREGKAHHVSQGALLAMDSSGGVTSMVGGLNYGKAEGQSEFNRTTQSLRAPGSSFKYFIYMTAMAKGYNPWMIRVDQPVVIGDWAPGNYEDKYYGPVTLLSAYAKSLNMVAIQLANEVGGAAVIDTAHSLGVGKRLADYRSLGLGAQGMTVMEMVTGYGAMAAGGYPIEPHGIERVRRANGQVLWARRPNKPPEKVIDDRTMRMMNLLGTTVVRAGTGTKAQIPGRMIAGKTGTSNDYRDAWFLGYVPGMVAGVWLGNDDNSSMNKVTGGLLSTEVWKDYMTTALRNTPIQNLPLPDASDYPPVPEPAALEMIETAPPPATIAPPVTALGAPKPQAVKLPPGDG